MELLKIRSVHSTAISETFDSFSGLTDFEIDGNASYRMTDDVRIIPAKIVFDGAFDGKVFNQSFTIVNCGKYSAFVRILPPSSKAFKMKPVPRGQKLSAGMSLSRNVSYTHTSAMALPEASFLVYINEKPLIYQIEVVLTRPHVILKPKVLDFGEIDARIPSDPKIITLTNTGKKKLYFSVDVKKTDLDLIVKPMKGTIDPSQVLEMSVEILGTTLGPFNKEFWIKTEPPQRVRVLGELCEPVLDLVYPLKSHRLALVDFSRTYYGANIKQNLIISNSSSVAAMFCVVLENNKGYDYVDKAKADEDFKCFGVSPTEGRLQAWQVSSLQFTFHPKPAKTIMMKPYKDFALVFLRVVKVHYRDGSVADDQVKAYEAAIDYVDSEDQESIDSIISEKPFYVTDGLEHDLQLCLYGEMEMASVELTPPSFYITYLKVNEVYTYDLNIRNYSTLPITVVYTKIACVEIEPKLVYILPESKCEVALIIKASRMGPVDVNVVFDLIHDSGGEKCKVGTACLPLQYFASFSCPPIEPNFNLGITPKMTNEVGYMVDDVRFNSSVSKPIQAIVDKNYVRFNKDNNDLIAFPNDRPKSLRPRKDIAICRTIYANIPRYTNGQNEYAMNDAQTHEKKYTKQLYIDYIRNSAKNRQELAPICQAVAHYEIGDERRILLQEVKIMDYKPCKPVLQESIGAYLPLSPVKLLGVRINPRYIELGKLAPHTSCRESFTIQNENEFAISVSIKAKCNAVFIKGKKRLTIEAQTTEQIFFTCTSQDIGKYYVPVYIVVNDNHIFDTIVFANVVPTTVHCPINELPINLKEKATCFEIFNPLNCDITFSWEVQGSNLDIYPLSGKIPPNMSLYCRLRVDPYADDEDALGNEIYLNSQSGAKHVITVNCQRRKADVGFSTQNLKFENIPLNTTVSKDLVLRNFSDIEIVYAVVNPNPLNEITVQRVKGYLAPKCDVIFNVSALFKDVVEFQCSLEFIIQHSQSYLISVEGNVIYPDIIIEPKFLQFRKSAAGTYQRKLVRVLNNSVAQCFIDFCLEDFPEICVADQDRVAMKMPIYLEPTEAKDLFIEFLPPEALVYSMYLPYIINGIIGPPALNDPDSVNPKTYVSCTTDQFKIPLELPEILPTVAVRCSAVKRWIEFSSLEINLIFGKDIANNCSQQLWTVKNVCHAIHCLTVPLIDPESCFYMDIEDGDSCQIRKQYYEVYLNPSEKIVFRITFKPTDFGTYNLELPIFFDKSVETCPLNYLKLTGTYLKPVMFCSKRILYYQIIPVPEQVSGTVTLTLSRHKKSCKIKAEVVDETLSIHFSDKTTTPEGNTEVTVTITFDPKVACFVNSEVMFKCSCNTSCKLIVNAGANNCVIESYATFIRIKALLLSKEFNSTFPFFPPPSSDDFYAGRLKFIVTTFEKFIFIQRMFCKDFLKIPDSLCEIPITIYSASKSPPLCRNRQVPLPPLANILSFIINPSVQKYFTDSSLVPTYEGVQGAVYLYTIYRNIISFLASQNVFVPQLEPEHLMPYKLYTIFKQNVNDGTVDNLTSPDETLSEEEFYSFSKQCWLDLLLKLFKVFVFDRILSPKPHSKKFQRPSTTSQTDIYYKDFRKYFAENKQAFEVKGVYMPEIRLLLWMEFHYERQKAVLFDLNEYPHLQEQRRFKSLETDFTDGIAFVTAIFAYCPYLKDFLRKFYPIADSEEKKFHNLCLIHESLKKIKLPGELLDPSGDKISTMHLLLAGSYLYDSLPGFYPRETITLSAPLGDMAVNELTLRNDNDYTVGYAPVFFFNEKEYFKVDSECLIIPPRKQKKIKITFNSKSILKINAVLVLSGETEGFKSAKSIAINLVGISQISEFTKSYKIKVDVFVNVTKQIEICSPYEESYTSKLYLYYGDLSGSPEEISNFTPVSQEKQKNLPRQISMQSQCTFEDGLAMLRLALCYVCVGEFVYYIYFVNEDVGDFCIAVNITANANKKKVTDLEVAVGRNFSLTIDCTCRTSLVCACTTPTLACSKLIIVEIPCKNYDLVEAIRGMFRATTEEHEYRFWNNLLVYPKGFHILRNRLKKSHIRYRMPYTNILRPLVKYRVEFSKSKVSFPEYITIDNVTSSKTFKFALHWNYSHPPKEELLTLYAEHGQEVRKYRLIFKLSE